MQAPAIMRRVLIKMKKASVYSGHAIAPAPLPPWTESLRVEWLAAPGAAAWGQAAQVRHPEPRWRHPSRRAQTVTCSPRLGRARLHGCLSALRPQAPWRPRRGRFADGIVPVRSPIWHHRYSMRMHAGPESRYAIRRVVVRLGGNTRPFSLGVARRIVPGLRGSREGQTERRSWN